MAYLFRVGERVKFTREAKLGILRVSYVIGWEDHIISAIEIFPETEWPNLVHKQLVTLDGDEKKRVSGFWLTPVSRRLLT